MEKVVKSVCYQTEIEMQIEIHLHTFYNLQNFSSQGLINTVIRRIKNVGVKSGGKNKPLELTKDHHQIDSSLHYIQVCAEVTGGNSTI